MAHHHCICTGLVFKGNLQSRELNRALLMLSSPVDGKIIAFLRTPFFAKNAYLDIRYWKCNFPMIPYRCPLVDWQVVRFVGPSSILLSAHLFPFSVLLPDR